MTAGVAAGALLALAMVLVAPACAYDQASAPPSTTAGPAGGPATPAADHLARYSRTGGSAGRRFEVVVRDDGTFEGGGGKPGRGHLGGDALHELRRLVADFRAARPEGSYGEVNPEVFVTTVAAGDTTTTVLTGGQPPEPVQALIGFLAGLERQLPR